MKTKSKTNILYALNKSGNFVSIADVPNGIKCDCFCAECGEELIAKNNGKIKRPHFAHKNGNDNEKCRETALHLMVKDIILKEKQIPIPRNNKIEFRPAEYIEKEKNMGDITPDLYAICEGRPFLIEILVTHKTNDEKCQKIANHKISCVEIDLSNQAFYSIEDVKSTIHNIQNIKILYDDDLRLIAERKAVLSKFGLKLKIQSGGIILCPYIGNIITKRFCEECTLCYSESASYIKCGIPIVVNQKTRFIHNIIVNQNKVLFPTEEKKHNKSHFSDWKVRQAIEQAFMSKRLLYK